MPDIYVRRRNDILWLLLNKNPHNTLSIGILEQCVTALQKALIDPPLLIVLTSTGDDVFSTGVEGAPPASELKQMAAKLTEIFRRLREQHIPTAALIKGDALDGGCELALLCDTLIARDDAHFRLSTPSTRLFPDPRSVQPDQEHATGPIPYNEMLDARQAQHLGLVQQVVPTRRFALDTEELLVMLAATAS